MAEVREMPEREPEGGLGAGLTVRQRKVLEVIRNSIDRRGYPPSMREIGDAVGLTSPSSVAHQLAALERKGYLRRDPNRPRAIEVVSPDTASDEPGYRGRRRARDRRRRDRHRRRSGPRPPTCRCSAGSPPACRSSPRRSSRTSSRSPARSSARARSSCSRWSATRWSTPPSATATGWSCASSRTPTTATSWRRCSTTRPPSRPSSARDGKVWLMPHNPAFSPIDGDHATILGKVTAVLRRV